MARLKELQCSNPDCFTVIHPDGVQVVSAWISRVDPAVDPKAKGAEGVKTVWIERDTDELDADGFAIKEVLVAMCRICNSKLVEAISAPGLGGTEKKSARGSARKSVARQGDAYGGDGNGGSGSIDNGLCVGCGVPVELGAAVKPVTGTLFSAVTGRSSTFPAFAARNVSCGHSGYVIPRGSLGEAIASVMSGEGSGVVDSSMDGGRSGAN